MTEPIRYIIGRGWADPVQDTTSLPHRELYVDEQGDVTVRRKNPRGPELSNPVIHQISGAELQFIARAARRERRRRFWKRQD